MDPIYLTLPWPDPKLSPNARVHHMALYRLKKRYRDSCYLATLAGKPPPVLDVPLEVRLMFCPSRAYHYDVDNLVAACKAGLDGVARALGVNDANFVTVTGKMADGAEVKESVVLVRIAEKEALL